VVIVVAVIVAVLVAKIRYLRKENHRLYDATKSLGRAMAVALPSVGDGVFKVIGDCIRRPEDMVDGKGPVFSLVVDGGTAYFRFKKNREGDRVNFITLEPAEKS
jgi:hypothetical protein